MLVYSIRSSRTPGAGDLHAMNDPILIGLSRQIALKQNLDIIANNMANINTRGFKGEELIFQEHLVRPDSRQATARDRIALHYAIDNGMSRDFSQGPFQATGNPMDVAMENKGWFVVETPQGERYTRNGAFTLNEQGEMVTSAGYRILGNGGPITFGPSETSVNITTDGMVSSNEGEKDRLRVVTFKNEARMLREGNNVFSSPEAPLDAETVRLAAGMLEGSNVKAVIETTRLIEVTRAYANTSKTIDQMDSLRRNAIERLGSPPQ